MNGPESVTKPIICNCYGSLPISSAFFFFISFYPNTIILFRINYLNSCKRYFVWIGYVARINNNTNGPSSNRGGV